MYLSACLRIRNEELIIEDTIRHLQRCGVDSFWIYNDRSTDRTLEILTTMGNWKGKIINFNNYDGNTFLLQGSQRNEIIQLCKNESGADWIIYQDADERFYPEINLKNLLLQYNDVDGVTVDLFDAYLTKDNCEYNGESLLELNRLFGPDYRRQLFFFKNKPGVFVPNGAFREPIGVKTCGHTIAIAVLHYGKGISVSHWEETCQHYIKNGSPKMKLKWSDRIGMALHEFSDLGKPLYDRDIIRQVQDTCIYKYNNFCPTISLSIIAKDESELIGDMLDSVGDIIDELVIVDTGSTDNTIDIAKSKSIKYGFDFKLQQELWEDDFAKHRNSSLGLCTKDWVLILDPDEQLDRSDLWRLYDMTLRGTKLYQLTTYNYSNGEFYSGAKITLDKYKEISQGYRTYGESVKGRFFPRMANLHWTGQVHELLEHSARDSGFPLESYSLLPVHHFGKERSVAIMDAKKQRQQELGEIKVKQNPNNSQLRFELGLQYIENGLKDKAIDQFTHAIRIDPTFADAYYNRGVIYYTLNELDKAEADFNVTLQMKPTSKDAMNNLAVLKEMKNDISGAIDIYSKLLELYPDFVSAYNNIGVCMVKTDKIADAIKYYDKAISLLASPPHIANKLVALIKLRAFDKGLDLVHQFIDKLGDFKEAYPSMVLVSIASSIPDLDLARKFLEASKDADIVLYMYNKAKIQELSGNIDDAIQILESCVADESIVKLMSSEQKTAIMSDIDGMKQRVMLNNPCIPNVPNQLPLT